MAPEIRLDQLRPERAAAQVGGVVLPWSYLTIGTLHFPWTFRCDPALVAASVPAMLRQVAAYLTIGLAGVTEATLTADIEANPG